MLLCVIDILESKKTDVTSVTSVFYFPELTGVYCNYITNATFDHLKVLP